MFESHQALFISDVQISMVNAGEIYSDTSFVTQHIPRYSKNIPSNVHSSIPVKLLSREILLR